MQYRRAHTRSTGLTAMKQSTHPQTHLPSDIMVVRPGATLNQVAGPVRTIIERARATLDVAAENVDEVTDSVLMGIADSLAQAENMLKACAAEYECKE